MCVCVCLSVCLFVCLLLCVSVCVRVLSVCLCVQINRPLSMKKDGIQTRKRKPKSMGVKSKTTIKSETSGQAARL